MTDEATIQRAYRVRLRETRAQARTLSRLLGAKRFVWNWALGRQETAWRAGEKRPSAVDLSREFTLLRRAPETVWLSELPRQPFNQVLRDLDRGWTNVFQGRAKRPRFKRRGTVSSVRFTLDQRRQQVDRESGYVQLDGIGKIRFRVTEPLIGRLRSATVSRDAAGRWHACFTADQVPAPASVPATVEAIGIDLGLKSMAVLSTGQTLAAPKSLAKAQRRLARYQRKMSRQRDAAARRQGLDPSKPFPKGTRIEASRRMRRTQRRIGRLHAKVADTRRWHQHQLSAHVVNVAEVICIEDLRVKAMARGMGRRAFRRSVGDAGLGEIRRQIEYKAAWYGRIVSVVDTFYPSSKTCSACGAVNTALQLKDRHWTCRQCNEHHDRDDNAAVNLQREGLRLLGATAKRAERDAREEGVSAGDGSSSPGQAALGEPRTRLPRTTVRTPQRTRKERVTRGAS